MLLKQALLNPFPEHRESWAILPVNGLRFSSVSPLSKLNFPSETFNSRTKLQCHTKAVLSTAANYRVLMCGHGLAL